LSERTAAAPGHGDDAATGEGGIASDDDALERQGSEFNAREHEVLESEGVMQPTVTGMKPGWLREDSASRE
jgi:hypothetical protein